MASWRGRSEPTNAAGRRRAAEPLDVALRFLAARPRSEGEVRRRLQRAALDEAEVERVLAQLRRHGLVDDAAFARYWVDQRQTFRPRGTRLLQAELRQRGVAAGLASEAAADVETSAEDDAYRAARKRAAQLRGSDERTFKQRLGQLLARRGFDWEVIAPAVARLWSELNAA